MKKVAELDGAELDYWIASFDDECEGLTFSADEDGNYIGNSEEHGICCIIPKDINFMYTRILFKKYPDANRSNLFAPSRDFAQGGKIIDRERIATTYFLDVWHANTPSNPHHIGDTHIQAAMRAYVALKYGDIVT